MNFVPANYGIGQPVARKEDARFVVGRGRYVDDLQLENQCHLHIVYSDRAHALLRRVDTQRARKAPGVIAVLTGEDCAADRLGGIEPRFLPQDFPFGWPAAFRTCRPILVHDKVRHVGERIAAIVAETPDQARDAAELIAIEYEDLNPVTEVEAALADGTPLVHDEAGSNRVWTLRLGDPAAAEKAFARAAHRVEVKVRHPRIAPSPMEPRAAVGVYASEEGLFTLYTATQAPHILRSELASFVLHVPESSVRVISNDVGGAFGLKTTPFAEDAIVLWAAKRVDRPVKWRGSRLDCMMSDDQGRGQIGRAQAAFDSEGRILAVRCRFLHDVGAYIVGAGTMPMIHSAKLVESIYRVPELDVESSLVFTNAPPTTPYRGAGRPEAIFAIERCLDEAAEILGIDRLEIRRRNMLRSDELPYQNHTGFVFDTGEFVEILDRCAQEADWKGFAQRQQSSAKHGKLRGHGIAYYTHDTGNLNDRMEIRFDPAGTVTVVSGAASTGMGHETVFSQMVSDWLGVPFEAVRFLQGDTWAVPYGRGSYASRSMTVCASALRVAADKIVEKGKIIASRMLEVSEGDMEFSHGLFRIAGTDRTLAIEEVARASFRPGMPIDNGIGLEAVGTFAVTQPSFPNGCHICEVEIDRETGGITVDRYAVVDDFGRVINPLLAEGQVHGGIAQGLGAALLEEIRYDPATGQLISGTYMDYTLPRAGDIPPIQASFHEVPCATNPVGVKGAGEGGTVGATAALFSAIRHALREVGVSDVEMPATTEKIWRAIRAAA